MALGAAAIAAIGVFGAHGTSTGAQSVVDPLVVEPVSVDDDGVLQDVPVAVVPAVSDTGGVIVYERVETGEADSDDTTRVWVQDRLGGTSRAVAEPGSAAPGISADGCLVAYSVLDAVESEVSLTVVDRCTAVAEDVLPAGTVLDTAPLPDDDDAVDDTEAEADAEADAEVDVQVDVEVDVQVDVEVDVEADAAAELNGEAELAADATADEGAESPADDAAAAIDVAPPALSSDGSTIVWSTGRDIRRYERPDIAEPFVRTATFDVSLTPTPEIVTGGSVDVSGDGGTIVFVAGPGTRPFVPAPANVYIWLSSDPADEPRLVSSSVEDASGDADSDSPGNADSSGPTISSDGTFVVFESSNLDLTAVGEARPTVPFVVGVDWPLLTAQVLVDDAARPVVSGDGLHVAYQRGDAIRVLSSSDGAPGDAGSDELAVAKPLGPVAISRHGRWLVFGSSLDLRTDDAQAIAVEGPAVWAADRASSSPSVVDTTTTTAPATTTTEPSDETTPSTSTPGSNGSTAPATTQPATPVLDRFPNNPTTFPRVFIPSTPRFAPSRPVVTTGTAPVVQEIPPSAAPVSFEATVVNSGRRVQPLTLFNSTTKTIGVIATSIDAVGPFSIVSDGCVGIRLAPATSCAVNVQFAPVDIGSATASASFRLDDDSVVSATLGGEGVPQPTLDLVPAVAGAGQTVTVFGVGFPAGSVVEMMQPGVETSQSLVVDPNGTFAHVIVVLPNTPTGPALVTVEGQPDLFGDVDAELLVSSRGTTSDGAALRRGVGNPIGR